MTKEILLNKGFVTLVDDDDYERFSCFNWTISNVGYAYRCEYVSKPRSQTAILLHRAVLDAPKGLIVDHINFNQLDNRKENLRLTTRSGNSRHTRGNTKATSKYKGVSWCSDKMKWKAQIRYDRKYAFLGRYDCEIEAARAYDRAAYEAYGEMGYYNFPEELRR